MRNYECMYILHPELAEEELKQLMTRFQNIVTDKGGIVDKVDYWGKRRLAYEVNKIRDGYYVLLLFQGEPAVVQELERIFKITENVVRYLIVRDESEREVAVVEPTVETAEEAVEETAEEAVAAEQTEAVQETEEA